MSRVTSRGLTRRQQQAKRREDRCFYVRNTTPERRVIDRETLLAFYDTYGSERNEVAYVEGRGWLPIGARPRYHRVTVDWLAGALEHDPEHFDLAVACAHWHASLPGEDFNSRMKRLQQP